MADTQGATYFFDFANRIVRHAPYLVAGKTVGYSTTYTFDNGYSLVVEDWPNALGLVVQYGGEHVLVDEWGSSRLNNASRGYTLDWLEKLSKLKGIYGNRIRKEHGHGT